MFYCNQRYNYLYDQIVITQNCILTVLYSLKCKFSHSNNCVQICTVYTFFYINIGGSDVFKELY